MFGYMFNEADPEGFLSWWNEHPIVLGGSKYSRSLGVSISYIPYSDSNAFELKIQPCSMICQHL